MSVNGLIIIATANRKLQIVDDVSN